MDYGKIALEKHKELKGKITVTLKEPLTKKEQLAVLYTPGVGAVSSYVAQHKDEVRDYTWIGNTVAVISDGSAVLGLGNIGPLGSLPVMEGKALLFKHFADIDAVPIILDVHSPDEIVAAVKAIAPSFGGINLEDIAAPTCFEVEERLKKELPIPVFHDDQHGTAVVTLAGLINAMKVTGKKLSDCRIVVIGAGAAGVAVANLLHKYAQPEIIAVDTQGVIRSDRKDLSPQKKVLASYNRIPHTGYNPKTLREALHKADVVIGISGPGMLLAEDIRAMNKDPIVFAMANPIPEIMPNEAKKAGVAVMATGRSDFPNQVNNAVAFPGIFRGALDNRVRMITDQHKIASAEAIAGLIENPTADEIIPSVMDDRLVPAIAKVIV